MNFFTTTTYTSFILIFLLILTTILSFIKKRKRVIEIFFIPFFISFSSFFQFFIFQRDAAHFSQFYPGFYIICIIAIKNVSFNKTLRYLFIFFLGLNIISYTLYATKYGKEGVGHIAQKQYRTDLYTENYGVKLYLSVGEKEQLKGLTDFLSLYRNNDYSLSCFQYCPGVLYIMNFRKIQHYQYIDKDFLRLKSGWEKDFLERMTKDKKTMIVVQKTALNNLSSAIFFDWAKKIQVYIKNNFSLIYKNNGYEVYFPNSFLPTKKALQHN